MSRRKKKLVEEIPQHSQTVSHTEISFVHKSNAENRCNNESTELVCDFGSVMH